MSNHERIRLLWQRLKHSYETFNLFPSVPPTNDEYKLQNQKISTRLFIILLIVILAILLFYTSLAIITKTITVKTPTIHQYLQLYARYPHTLTCACTKISIKYENIVNVKYSFHQVCTSDFVSDDWINYLDLSHTKIIIPLADFRRIATNAFQSLSLFCQQMNTTISSNMDRLYSSEYISAFVIPSELFRSQVQVSITQFILTTKKRLLSSQALVRDTISSNSVLSALQTDFILYVPSGSEYASSWARAYNNCDCYVSPMCIEESIIQSSIAFEPDFTVPGFYIGCYIIESLLQSTLECFYDQTCINTLQSYYRSPTQSNVTALNPSLSSQYFVNSTIQALINNLMVEQWNISEKYNSYYNACQPSECIYTYSGRNGIIYIVTTLIGLVGGLITVLKIGVPLLVNFVSKCFMSPRPETGKIKDVIVFHCVNIYALFVSSEKTKFEILIILLSFEKSYSNMYSEKRTYKNLQYREGFIQLIPLIHIRQFV